MKFSQHALVRSQNRALPPPIIDLLLDFGQSRRRGKADVHFLTRSGRAKLIEAIGSKAYGQIARKLDSYVVISDQGSVITVARRLRRIRRA